MPPPDIAPRRERQFTYWLLALVALGGLTWLFDGLVEERVNPNREVSARVTSSGDTEVVLRQNHQGHYVASGTINGAPVVFLLDTGATDVSVPERVAEQAGLQPGARIRVRTANGDIEVYRTRIASLALGGLRLDDVEASINPFMESDEVLLGMSALRALHMTQTEGTLTIRAPGSPP
jgi:aspartyl protease family protein